MANIDSRKALGILTDDAEKIENLISVQLDNLTLPKCPLYEDVLDTQMFGLSREIDFAVRLGLVTKEQGSNIIDDLEKKLADFHNLIAYEDMQN